MAPRMACNRVWKKTMVALGMGGRERWLSGLSGGGGEWQQPDILDAFSAREARLDALWTPVGQNHLRSSPRPATERSVTLNPTPDGLTTHIRHSKTPFLSFKIWTYHSRHIPLFENISTYCAAELYSSHGPPSLLPSPVQVSSPRPPSSLFGYRSSSLIQIEGAPRNPFQKPPDLLPSSPKPVVASPPPIHIDAQNHVLSFAVPCQRQK